jgi:hypothetical protein
MPLLAVTQDRQKEFIEGKSIIKELLNKFGMTSAKKMYCDTIKGESKHIGYVLTSRGSSALWVTLYKVEEWTK